MKKIEEKYTQLCMESSDINEHLPVLKRYAEECSHITEMGTRYVVSTWAFLFGKPNKLTCYDILIGLDMNIVKQRLSELEESAKEIGVDFTFTKGDVLALDIEETDLLFIDTYHEYNQIKSELKLHSDKVKKYLIFHDTTTFGEHGETFKEPNTKGIWPAIEEFLAEKPEWEIAEKFENNNGLTILKRNNG
jgi:cephalosporin hydroxylase